MIAQRLGPLPVAAIDTGLVVKTLREIWTAATAMRVRGRIESVLNWAAAKGYRSGENPARWKGHLDHILPRKDKLATVEHHKALPIDQAPSFFAQLIKIEGVAARAIEMLVPRRYCASPTWVQRRLQARPPNSASSSPTKRRNGAR